MRAAKMLPFLGAMLAVACGASVPAGGTSMSATPAHPSPTVAGVPSPGAADMAVDAATSASEGDGSVSPATAAPNAEFASAAGRPQPDASLSSGGCNEQPPQSFLVRGNFLKAGAAGNERAIQYRTEEYGYFKGYGRPGPDAQPPSAHLVDVTFMGLAIKMHRKVVPALKCVEDEIHRACTDHPYTPHALAGIRYRNTYRGGEVTNHAYGIAIDIDPAINTCCGCVKPWNDAPACKRAAATEYDRMAMPECWVHAFERFGFYWLGHDVLRDTMHFEFLGDPERILKAGAGS